MDSERLVALLATGSSATRATMLWPAILCAAYSSSIADDPCAGGPCAGGLSLELDARCRSRSSPHRRLLSVSLRSAMPRIPPTGSAWRSLVKLAVQTSATHPSHNILHRVPVTRAAYVLQMVAVTLRVPVIAACGTVLPRAASHSISTPVTILVVMFGRSVGTASVAHAAASAIEGQGADLLLCTRSDRTCCRWRLKAGFEVLQLEVLQRRWHFRRWLLRRPPLLFRRSPLLRKFEPKMRCPMFFQHAVRPALLVVAANAFFCQPIDLFFPLLERARVPSILLAGIGPTHGGRRENTKRAGSSQTLLRCV